jgi:hypothetical protein
MRRRSTVLTLPFQLVFPGEGIAFASAKQSSLFYAQKSFIIFDILSLSFSANLVAKLNFFCHADPLPNPIKLFDLFYNRIDVNYYHIRMGQML